MDKPLLRYVQVEYWDCGNQDHRHKTERVAKACLTKIKKAKANYSAKGNRRWTRESCADLLARQRSGEKKADLAKSLKLSLGRLGEVLKKARALEKRHYLDPIFASLSNRTFHCLMAENLVTFELAKRAFEHGELDNIPNFGEKSKIEVQCWIDETERLFL